MNGLLEQAVRRGGVSIAQLDRTRGGHVALVRVIERAIPFLFNPTAAAELDAVFALEITGARPTQLGLTVRGGRLTVSRGRPVAAAATVSIAAGDAVLLATGEAGWPELIPSGRLALSGDPFVALRFPRLFGLPPSRARR